MKSSRIERTLESILQTMRNGSRVEIRRFGTFATRQRGGRIARNQKSGEQVVVVPKRVAFFRAGKELLEVIQHAPESQAKTEKPS